MVTPFSQPESMRQLGVYLVITAAITFAVLKVVWSIDEHFISRAEFTSAVERLEGEIRSLRPLPRVTP